MPAQTSAEFDESMKEKNEQIEGLKQAAAALTDLADEAEEKRVEEDVKNGKFNGHMTAEQAREFMQNALQWKYSRPRGMSWKEALTLAAEGKPVPGLREDVVMTREVRKQTGVKGYKQLTTPFLKEERFRQIRAAGAKQEDFQKPNGKK
jgi:hypothetical protein